jgi:membrane protease subunit (stomatin/prohibitin family)
MVFKWLSNETKSAYIARPAEHASDLIYLHPDKSIPRGAKVTVRSDECVLFFREGQYVGRINPGTVLLDTANIPFLGHLLVDNYTDGNHFLCELFFVLMRESIIHVPSSPREPPASLGQYRDMNSARVVAITGELAYTVKVSDPVTLVSGLGGQNAKSQEIIEGILNGRVLNQVRRVIGERTRRLPVLDVVSNVDAEIVSEEVKGLVHKEFDILGLGIGRVFDVSFSLDADSLSSLRDFGHHESQLKIQEKGMKLATGDGFAEFNMIQGQRAALEGLGKGLGTGNGPVVMTGMNLGGNLTGYHPPAGRVAPGRPGPILGARASFHLQTETGEIGPMSARQLALLAISKGLQLSEMIIRGSEDAEGSGFPAAHEPQIVAEYKRRMPTDSVKRATGAIEAFDLAFAAAIEDGKITAAEFSMLVNLSVALALDRDAATAEARVRFMAQTKNIPIVD